MNDQFKVVLDLPYPKIEISKKDTLYAYKIFKIYSGNLSEFTSIAQYAFQSSYLNKYKDLSKILEEIAMVEMKHLRILADLITDLGLIPYYVTYCCGTRANPWNSDYGDYTTDYRNMLLSNINLEVAAIKDYNELINQTNDANIKDIFKRIIQDEERHVEIFKELLRQYDSYE